MARKFGEEFEIRLDSHKNKIANKVKIISSISTIKTEQELKAVLEYYYRIFETNGNVIDKNDLKEIVMKLKEHQSKINTTPLVDFFNEAKKNNSNLKNITVVKTEKEDNDKINGMKRGVTYIEFKINGVVELYEVLNENAIEQILKTQDILDNLSEHELIEQLKEHAIKRNVTKIDRRPSESLNSDAIKKEIENIQESYVKEAFLKEEQAVLKERVDLQKYIDVNMPGAIINYSLNSNGERIYIVDDKVFKFVGEERELKELSSDELSSSGSFEHNKKGTGSINVNVEEIITIEDYCEAEEYIANIIESISMNIGINDNQIDFLTKFLEKCLSIEESATLQKIESADTTIETKDIPGELKELYEKYCGYAKENDKYVNERIREIIERREELKKLSLKEERKENTLETPHELKLTPNKLTNWEKAGFISVTIILESSVIIGGILAILALVKK